MYFIDSRPLLLDPLFLHCRSNNDPVYIFSRRQRVATLEREVEQVRHQLSVALSSAAQPTDRQHPSPPDMEYAIDILKRSSLEVELAAKEKEVYFIFDLQVSSQEIVFLA